jgi:hypothetical protein
MQNVDLSGKYNIKWKHMTGKIIRSMKYVAWNLINQETSKTIMYISFNVCMLCACVCMYVYLNKNKSEGRTNAEMKNSHIVFNWRDGIGKEPFDLLHFCFQW